MSEPIPEPVRPSSSGTKQQRKAAPSNITTQHETLLVYNLLDVDEETLYYWVKSVTGVWPTSIHLSESEEKAIVKIPLVNQGLGTCFQGFHGSIVVKDVLFPYQAVGFAKDRLFEMMCLGIESFSDE